MPVEPSQSDLAPDVASPPIEQPAPAAPTQTPLAARLVAIAEVTLCSGFPTQLGLGAVLILIGASPQTAEGQLSLAYIVVLSFTDAALVLLLVWLLLRAHGENVFGTLCGTRPVRREALVGLALVPAVFVLVAVTFSAILRVAPWLHNVEENPLEALMQSPGDAVWFGLVAVVFGVLREEVQRGFILRRFEQQLGGGTTGLVVFSVAFGLGHVLQGWDAAIVTGLLGAFWGSVFLRRRSIVAPIVCHAIFNLVEILIAYRANVG